MMIKTDIVHINSELNGKKEALYTVDTFNSHNNFIGMNALHIRLLTEELICMVHGIFEGFLGNLWLESSRTENGVICSICLSANKTLNAKQEEQLISVSTKGRNEYANGILGKIREAFRVSAQYSGVEGYMNSFCADNKWYRNGIKAVSGSDGTNAGLWSLKNYRDNLSGSVDEGEEEERNELERSIIARLADDVKVWITNETTEVIIIKKITE